MINHEFLYPGIIPQPVDHVLYAYITAANGVFIHAKRKNLEVMLPVFARKRNVIRGLAPMQPFIKLPDLVPAQYLQSIIRKSQRMLPNEALFYLSYETAWKAVMPNQRVTQTSVTPSDPFDDFSSRALIELHSHNTMPARFSSIDDGDETGFKLYAVIGNITGSKIELCVRVGIYGHFCEVPAKLVFQSMIEVCDVGRY